jgi:hypothetical protein|tara:strand:- start:20 stop:250 length:231 start_codon:yes stop_codon:yes gene_type:complete
MIKEHDRIVLMNDIPSEGLLTGDVGTVIHVYKEGEAFEVEFVTLGGETVSVITLPSSQVRAVDKRDIANARKLAIS